MNFFMFLVYTNDNIHQAGIFSYDISSKTNHTSVRKHINN